MKALKYRRSVSSRSSSLYKDGVGEGVKDECRRTMAAKDRSTASAGGVDGCESDLVLCVSL